MAEEFQSGISSGNWWKSARNINELSSSSPCSTTLTDIGSYGSAGNWSNTSSTSTDRHNQHQMVDMKTARLSGEQSSSVSVSGSSSIINYQSDHQTTQTAPHQQVGSSSDSHDHGSVLMDSSNLQIMGFDLSSSPSADWTQTLLNRSSSSGRAGETNFNPMLQESDDHNQVQKEWSSGGPHHEDSTSSVHEFKQIHNVFSLDDQQCFNPCDRGGSPMLLHGLYEPLADQQQVLQQSSYDDNRKMTNYSTSMNFCLNSNELSPSSWSPKFPQFLKPTAPLSKQQQQQQQQQQQPSNNNNQLHFSNNTQFWNAASSTTAMTGISSSLFSSPRSTQFLSSTVLLDDDQNPNYCSNLTLKPTTEEVRDLGLVTKKNSGEPAFKRPRIETPSPLPTFKVRKEKLGDRITALQQLCSPFGKTDTASVLYEAIEYIKFLHEQVTILSNPYMKNNGAPIQYQQNSDKSKEGEGLREDLRSRGLCLVPISSTFSVTTDANTDFWTPTFGGTYR